MKARDTTQSHLIDSSDSTHHTETAGVSITPPSYGMEFADQAMPERDAPVQRLEGTVSSPPPTLNDSNIPAHVQTKMETAFASDFSRVRIHPRSMQAPKMGAVAFTQGHNIHFAPGAFQPHSIKGQELLGHELAHVVQQRQGRVKATTQFKGVKGNDQPALEKEADQMGRKSANGIAVYSQQPSDNPPPFWGQMPAQRAIGFELQLIYTNLWEGKNDPGTTLGNQTKGNELLDYGDKVYEDKDKLFHIESDDGELEFVTNHFQENAEGMQKLVDAMQAAQHFTLTMSTLVNQNEKHPFTSVKAVADALKGDGGTVNKDANIGAFGNKGLTDTKNEFWTSAKPQVSFGIPLEKIQDLAQAMISGEKGLAEFDEKGRKAVFKMANYDIGDPKEGMKKWGESFMGEMEVIPDSDQFPKASNLAALISLYVKEANQEIMTDELGLPVEYRKIANESLILSKAIPSGDPTKLKEYQTKAEEEKSGEGHFLKEKEKFELEISTKKEGDPSLAGLEEELQIATENQELYKADKERFEKISQAIQTKDLGAAEHYSNNFKENIEMAKLWDAYILKGKKYHPREYPKIAHSIMARTNFRLIYSQLKEPDQLMVQKFTEGLIKRSLSEQMYPGGYYDDSLDPTFWASKNRGNPTEKGINSIVEGPTIKQWLDSIFTEKKMTAKDAKVPIDKSAKTKDPLPPDFRSAPYLHGTPKDRGMGALNKMDNVPMRETDKSKVKMEKSPVFEYRLFEGPLFVKDWTNFAVGVANVLLAIHKGGAIELSLKNKVNADKLIKKDL